MLNGPSHPGTPQKYKSLKIQEELGKESEIE